MLSVVVVLLTGGLYYSFIYKYSPETAGVSFAINSGLSGGSMLDSAGLRKPLEKIYPDGVSGITIDSVRLTEIEAAYLENPYVKSGKVYFDKHRMLKIEVRQRVPVLRIIGDNGTDYYLDDEGSAMPVSEHYTPKVMVATGNIPTLAFDENVDSSAVHRKIFELAETIEQDEFMKSFISEIHVGPQQQIYMHPLVGQFRIRINDLSGLEDKLDNLKIFLKEGLSRTGWDVYKEIVIDYNNQIIGKKILNP